MEHRSSAAIAPRIGIGLRGRAAILFCTIFAEKIFLNSFVDFNAAQTAQGAGAALRIAQHYGFRFLVAFAAALALLTYVRGGQEFKATDTAVRDTPVRLSWLSLHGILVVLLAPLCYSLYRNTPGQPSIVIVVALGATIAVGAILTGLLAIATPQLWRDAARSLGVIWWYAAIAAFFAMAAIELSQSLWHPTAAVTFWLVNMLLAPIKPTLAADPITMVLSTDRFAVQIADVCSGLEGIGLMLAFSAAWLVYFRREYVFPRALLLMPAGAAAMFVLNVFRIAALLLIGDAGFQDVAVYGFHSQAGWLAFNAVACALVYFSRRSAWLNRTAVPAAKAIETYNPTAAYLMPLLAILGAGVLSHAVSGSFEVFYPLRFVAAFVALYCYRRTILQFDWRFSWRGPAVGTVVFLVWLIAAHVLSSPAAMPWQLHSIGPIGGALWITIRALASITTVPIAEEIAYRGYLMRRLSNSDFESLPYRSVSLTALLVSALVFGLSHGAFWLPGIFAGIAYGLLLRRTGRMGEAVIAHAVSNALIVICVLAYNMWQLW
jgi:exosortase E/protease (VPEID-CTERM system)